MNINEKKYFASPDGGGNFDDADFALGLNQWMNLENARVLTTDAGVTGTLESIGSTLMLSSPQPSVVFTQIGSAVEVPRNRFCYFLYNTTGAEHKILCFDVDAGSIYTVLLSSQVTGGLTFSKDKPIHSARIINGVLYWVDDLNENRRVNIDAGIKLNHPTYSTTTTAYTSPLSQSVITLVRNPPAFPATWVKEADVSFPENYIKKEAFQFYYRYTYREYEDSRLSPLSTTANYNVDNGSAENRITITIPLDEIIEQDVLKVDLCVKFLNGGKTFIIRTWDKNITADNTAINNHNAGTTALSYQFFNSQALIGVDDAYAIVPFDSVPVRSETLEIAQNRVHLGNNVEGYDTPLAGSLTALVSSISISGGGSFDVYLVQAQFRGGTSYLSYSAYYANITSISPVGYYRLTDYTVTAVGAFAYPPFPVLGAVPATITSDKIVFGGATSGDVQNSISPPSNMDFFSLADTGSNTTLTLSVGVTKVQKAASTKQVGIVFYDKALRRCGVFTSPDLIIDIPERTYTLTTLYTGISWFLSNTSSANEIPDWAYYYQIVVTDALNISFFSQAVTNEIKYVTLNAAGEKVYNSTTSGGEIGIAINTDYLVGYGMGYIFNEGDVVKIWKDSVVAPFTVEVTGQEGRYIFCSFVDLDTTAGEIYIYQVWTPNKYLQAPLFFEIGQLFDVLNPTTSTRAYSVTSGVIPGDVYLATRTHAAVNYTVERMSPNDEIWKNWNTDAGRPNIVDSIGQQDKTNSISYSNTYIQGTKINGLSQFEALNEKPIPLECGPIRKLQLTSKVQGEQGVVMLCVCEKETASLYLGEVQQYGSSKQTTLTIADEVIGTINVLKGNFGTVNPESVCEYRGNVFWLDAINGKFIQYSTNGLFPISNYKMTRFWKLFCDLYTSMTNSEIESLGARPFVYTAVDPHHNELLVSIPKLSNVPPKGYLPDYPSTIYPWDIWDAQGKTLVYRLDANPNFWQGAYSFNPEGFVALSNKLYSFRSGLLFEHNQTTSYNQFYGTQYKSRVMPVWNMEPSSVKVYNNILLESNMVPTLTYFRSESPYQQASDLVDFDWNNLEGLYYSTIYRNKLVPTATGFNTSGLMTAEKIRTYALRVLLEFTVSTVPLELRFATIGFDISKGHKT